MARGVSRTSPWPSWTLYVRSGVAYPPIGAKHSPPGAEKWKNQGPTIMVFLAASHGASAKNIEDPAKCYYTQVEDTESFQVLGQYLQSVSNCFVFWRAKVQHEVSMLTHFGPIFRFFRKSPE